MVRSRSRSRYRETRAAYSTIRRETDGTQTITDKPALPGGQDVQQHQLAIEPGQGGQAGEERHARTCARACGGLAQTLEMTHT